MGKRHREAELGVRIRAFAANLLRNVKATHLLVGNAHNGHAGKQVGKVVARDILPGFGQVLAALPHRKTRGPFVNRIGLAGGLQSIVKHGVAVIVVLQVLDRRVLICHPIPRAVVVLRAQLRRGHDVVQRRVDVVVSSELNHRADDAPHAARYGHTVIRLACIGIHAGVVHNHLGERVVYGIPVRRAHLGNVVGARLKVAEHRSAIKRNGIRFFRERVSRCGLQRVVNRHALFERRGAVCGHVNVARAEERHSGAIHGGARLIGLLNQQAVQDVGNVYARRELAIKFTAVADGICVAFICASKCSRLCSNRHRGRSRRLRP